jgi:translation initiation factor 4E
MSLLLEHEWNAWYDHSTPGRSAKDYDKGLFALCTMKTVEDFWGCYNNLPTLSSLDSKCGFHFMIKGVRPVWEDDANKNGGVWRIRVQKEAAEAVWKEILMSLVGDVYVDEVGITVNGASIANKGTEYVLTIWMSKDVQSVDVVKYFLGLCPQVSLVADPAYQSCLILVKNNS